MPFLALFVELPLLGLRLTQVASALIDQSSVPPPEFHIAIDCIGRLEDPSVAVRSREDGLNSITEGSTIVRLTGIV
jgi:hypothetical protein